MKRTILALALVATTFGAFAQTPAATAKPVAHKVKASKKAEVKKTEAAKPAEAVKTTPAAAPKAPAKHK
jgi:flagellar motor component MotA